MNFIASALLISFLSTFSYFIFRISWKKSGASKLFPPGPCPYPIVGNFFQLGKKPHHTITSLAQKYGPVMTLKLGSVITIAVSSPSACKQVLQKHDHLLCNRMIPDSVTSLDHHKFSMLWLPVGTKWRNLRTIWTIQLFTAQRLDASQGLRRQKVQELLDHVKESCKTGAPIDIGRNVSTTSLNLMSNTLLSIDLAHYGSKTSQEMKDLIWNVIEESGKPNIGDYIPALRKFDLQGMKRRTAGYLRKMFATFDGIVNERVRLRSTYSKSMKYSSTNNDMLDALLDLIEENDDFNLGDVKHILLDLFIAGTDTSSSTVEWAMAELIRYPEKMSKVKFELNEIIGHERAIQESDIASLPYLQAIVKETLRVHPPGAFLFHKADAEVEIEGYTIPKDAQILVNSWAVCLDPKIWPNPHLFLPERFLDDKFYDVKGGDDFEFIPFGAGRRKCPGMPLANRMVHLVLACLLHSFDWKLEDGKKTEDMDMTDKFGIVLTKAKPLFLVPGITKQVSWN